MKSKIGLKHNFKSFSCYYFEFDMFTMDVIS